MRFLFDKSMVSVIVCESPRLASEKLRSYCAKDLESVCPYKIERYVQKDDEKLSLVSYYETLLNMLHGNTGFVFICEHDCLYPASYFKELEPRYGQITMSYPSKACTLSVGGFSFRPPFIVSGLFGGAAYLADRIADKLREHDAFGRCVWAEPGVDRRGRRDGMCLTRDVTIPHIDIRHGKNFTGNRIANDTFEFLDGYPKPASELWAAISD